MARCVQRRFPYTSPNSLHLATPAKDYVYIVCFYTIQVRFRQFYASSVCSENDQALSMFMAPLGLKMLLQ